MDVIKSFGDLTDKVLPAGWIMKKYAQHLVMYDVYEVEEGPSVIGACIRADLRVKLFHEGDPLPLPEWFRKRSNCRRTRCSMVDDLANYVEVEGEQTSDIFKELKALR